MAACQEEHPPRGGLSRWLSFHTTPRPSHVVDTLQHGVWHWAAPKPSKAHTSQRGERRLPGWSGSAKCTQKGQPPGHRAGRQMSKQVRQLPYLRRTPQAPVATAPIASPAAVAKHGRQALPNVPKCHKLDQNGPTAAYNGIKKHRIHENGQKCSKSVKMDKNCKNGKNCIK